MELGQMIFGNPTGEYECPEYVKALVTQLLNQIDSVYWNINQKKWDWESDPGIPGITFRSYYWGDCDCGQEQAEWEWCETHGHKQMCYQSTYATLEKLYEDKYGVGADSYRAAVRRLCEMFEIPWNDGYGCAVHCTCGHDEEYAKWAAEHPHSPECTPNLPNLKFGEAEIRWYKHPPRGMTVNVAWGPAEWAQWYTAAIQVIHEVDRVNYEERMYGDS